MGRFLLLGATLAALVQTFLPQSVIGGVAGVPILSVVVMMGLAIVLSLCSESDAFIAASFVQFGVAAQLAFLVFGPMVDFKLGALYTGTFRRPVVRAILVTTFAATQADEFLLTRYVITCCVADATIVQVRVVNVPPGAVQPNDWVDVKGQIYPLGRTMLVNASSVKVVPRPSHPYLTP